MIRDDLLLLAVMPVAYVDTLKMMPSVLVWSDILVGFQVLPVMMSMLCLMTTFRSLLSTPTFLFFMLFGTALVCVPLKAPS